MKAWYVYIAEGNDGSFYTGVSSDPERRIKEHNSGSKGSKWARGRRPLRLRALYEAGRTRGEALKEEAYIKTLSHADKEELVSAWKVP